MLNKLRIALLSGTAVAVLMTAFSFLPLQGASAQTYSAGNFRPGTSICSCPVTVGNCVCEYNPPPPCGDCAELEQ